VSLSQHEGHKNGPRVPGYALQRCISHKVEPPSLLMHVNLCPVGPLQEVSRAPNNGAAVERGRTMEGVVQGRAELAHNPLPEGSVAREVKVARDVLLCDAEIPRGDVGRKVQWHQARRPGEVTRLAHSQDALREVEGLDGAETFKAVPQNDRPWPPHFWRHKGAFRRAIQAVAPLTMPVPWVEPAAALALHTVFRSPIFGIHRFDIIFSLPVISS